MTEEESQDDGLGPIHELASRIIRVERKYFYGDQSNSNRLAEIRVLIDESLTD